MRLIETTVLLFALQIGLGACSRPASDKSVSDYSTVEMVGARNMFMGGVITPAPSSGKFLAIIELTPAEHNDLEKMGNLIRAGHPVSLRIREEPDAPPIMVTDITTHGAIISCKSLEEAKRVIDLLHAWPSR